MGGVGRERIGGVQGMVGPLKKLGDKLGKTIAG